MRNAQTVAEPAPRRDGRRYEVMDGRLQVTGTQPPLHHTAVVALMVKLKHAAPPNLRVAVGSLDFRPTPPHTLRPDLLVCRTADAGLRHTTRLLVAVEVLSPSTRITDVVHKRAQYERFAVPSYWLLDPDRQELTVLELAEAHYVCTAVVQADEAHTVSQPFPLTLTPAELTG
ncbi:protein of unknown function DUF820 [Kribbella flavida DSM 17836]|uniref:Putative restriction endonuclease domain-containing protein n=1 Tax=Kribbella flavida (strain DSM 17836 / JCM 10339 / NBRC 14399) TaxID=479435 RepID=D2PLA4_KRIFD|nr:Uma2 family endonuclease [Kribbella flavida]ADB34359.1 protein of unknown function DUF820 [Kribbella flavida DSM 17836]